MSPTTTSEKIISALRLRCPRCGEGKLFKDFFRMNSNCSECQYSLDPGPGFYVGSIYPNIAATVVLVTGFYWFVAFGIGMETYEALWWSIGFIFFFQLWFHRYARSVWMAFMYEAKFKNQAAQEQADAKLRESSVRSNDAHDQHH